MTATLQPFLSWSSDSHLLLVLLCERQHGGDVEHDLVTLKDRVHGVCPCGVAWETDEGKTFGTYTRKSSYLASYYSGTPLQGHP